MKCWFRMMSLRIHVVRRVPEEAARRMLMQIPGTVDGCAVRVWAEGCVSELRGWGARREVAGRGSHRLVDDGDAVVDVAHLVAHRRLIGGKAPLVVYNEFVLVGAWRGVAGAWAVSVCPERELRVAQGCAS